MVATGGNDPSVQANVLAVILASEPVDELLSPLAGHPLIAYSVVAALQAHRVAHILVVGDVRLAEVARGYARSQSRSEAMIENLHLPPGIHSDRASLTYAIEQWIRRHSTQQDSGIEMAVALQPEWPLFPQGVLDKAIELLRHNPQVDEIVSLAPVARAYRWWITGMSGTLAPLFPTASQPGFDSVSMPADTRLYAETGHFRVVRPDSTPGSNSTLPFVLGSEFGRNAAIASERQWAEWQVQFSALDIVYPGHHPRPLPDKVALLVMDFDGVITDNRVWVDEAGHERIAANRSDSLGLLFLRRAGIEALVISMETSLVVAARCKKMNVPVLQGITDKAAALNRYLEEKSIDPAQVVYLGNDVNDLVCFPLVACAVAVADSLPTVLHAADLVLTSRGGHAAVRELCDLLIQRAGK